MTPLLIKNSRYEPIMHAIKPIFFTTFILLSFVLGYEIQSVWWKFAPSTILIICGTYILYRPEASKLLGLLNFKKWIFSFLICCGLFYYISRELIYIALSTTDYRMEDGYVLNYLSIPFQTLNEEIVLRAMLLYLLIRLKWNSWIIALIPAILFSAIHFAFYYFNNRGNEGSIEFFALISLFMFSISGNLIYLKTKNIGIPWALHCGWNFNQFGNIIKPIDKNSPNIVSEFMTFNLLEGSGSIVVFSTILSIISVLIYTNKLPRLSKYI